MEPYYFHKICSKTTQNCLFNPRFRWINSFITPPKHPHPLTKTARKTKTCNRSGFFLPALHFPRIVFHCFVRTIPRKPKNRENLPKNKGCRKPSRGLSYNLRLLKSLKHLNYIWLLWCCWCIWPFWHLCHSALRFGGFLHWTMTITCCPGLSCEEMILIWTIRVSPFVNIYETISFAEVVFMIVQPFFSIPLL